MINKINEILRNDKSREEQLEEIARMENITTDLTRTIYIDEELNMKEGDIINNIGLHWSDINNKHFGQNGGYTTDDFDGTAVIFKVENVSGHEVKYINELYAEENNLDEEQEEELLELYQDFYTVLGTDEDSYYEAEVLVSNEKQFEVVDIYEPNEETNFYEVYLKEVK